MKNLFFRKRSRNVPDGSWGWGSFGFIFSVLALSGASLFSFIPSGSVWSGLVPPSAFAQEINPKDQDSGKIDISADKLITDQVQGHAEFIGSVMASGKDFSVSARRLKIYGANRPGKKGTSLDQNSIEKITALGDVNIKFDNRLAMSDEAVYIIKDQRLVLTGENALLVSGKDRVTGKRIIFDRKHGKITVEGDDRQRVNAVFYPKKEKTIH